MTDMALSSFFDPTNSSGTSPAATEAVAALEAIADAERAVGMAAYMRDQFEFFGIAATPRKEAVKEIIAKRSLDWALVLRCGRIRDPRGRTSRLTTCAGRS